jgi:hypothetical protein
MRSRSTLWLFVIALSIYATASSQDQPHQAPPEGAAVEPGGDFSNNMQGPKVPSGVILVKGAWASASDSVTPLPEGGSVRERAYVNPYFGLAYPLSLGFTEKSKGPPPSSTGYYVLAELRSAQTPGGQDQGAILIAAQDLFFGPTPIIDAMQMVQYTRSHLNEEYRVASEPTEIKLANHSFARLGYTSPAAGLEWYIVATKIRCHAVQFVFTSRYAKLIDRLMQEMNTMVLPAEAGDTSGAGSGEFPVCIKDYAKGPNVVERVDPAFTEHKFYPVPVRIIIDKNGRVKHIHFISAFPDQAKAISDALLQWRFKPYLKNGAPAEVETGIMFGRIQRPVNVPNALAVAD